MVIISSGALSTPQILQRSGIGDPEKLKACGIEVISDLPGVGQNYQDHQVVSGACIRVDVGSDDTADDFFRGHPETMTRLTEEFKSGKGILASNFVDTGLKIRPTDAEVKSMGADFEKAWNEYFVNKPDKALLYMGIMSRLLACCLD
jgi:alcohol oxidase